MAGWFELSKSSDDQYRFVLKAGNGEIILPVSFTLQKVLQKKGSHLSRLTALWMSVMRKKQRLMANYIST